MLLDVAALRAGVVLELAPGRIERIAKRDRELFILRMRDGDLAAGPEVIQAVRGAT